jgi:hypothetical protein
LEERRQVLGADAVRGLAQSTQFEPELGVLPQQLGASMARAQVSIAGGSNASCQDLNDEYVGALEDAKKCAYGTQPDPCTEKVKGDLECQCPMYINPGNTEAVANLTQIEASWTANGCVPSMACFCADPTYGACYPGSAGPQNGSCADS